MGESLVNYIIISWLQALTRKKLAIIGATRYHWMPSLPSLVYRLLQGVFFCWSTRIYTSRHLTQHVTSLRNKLDSSRVHFEFHYCWRACLKMLLSTQFERESRAILRSYPWLSPERYPGCERNSHTSSPLARLIIPGYRLSLSYTRDLLGTQNMSEFQPCIPTRSSVELLILRTLLFLAYVHITRTCIYFIN
jgi:hypothetical protein